MKMNAVMIITFIGWLSQYRRKDRTCNVSQNHLDDSHELRKSQSLSMTRTSQVHRLVRWRGRSPLPDLRKWCKCFLFCC